MAIRPVVNSAISREAENIRRSFECPISLELMDQAVMLRPCGHRMNEPEAKRLFGERKELKNGLKSWRNTTENTCPECRRPVMKFIPDILVRNIVQELFKTNVEQVIQQIREHSIQVAQAPLPFSSYPGKSAKFIIQSNKWDQPFDLGHGILLCRKIEFDSITEGSLIKNFSFFGYQDGSIAIIFEYKAEDLEQLRLYLFSRNITPQPTTNVHFETEQCRTLFKIISDNNEFPEESFRLMKDCIERGHT